MFRYVLGKSKHRVGRDGGGAGSIIAYILRITSIDPLQHNLPFERFLNPERESTPDFDIDFSDFRRDEVIEYIRKNTAQNTLLILLPLELLKHVRQCAILIAS